MSISLSRKAEKAIALDYLPNALGIGKMNIYQGHGNAEIIELPCLIVYAESSSHTNGMPVETFCRSITIRCKFRFDSATTQRGDVDEWAGRLESAMINQMEDLKTALNKPSGVDHRTIKGIHFHYIELSDDPSDVGETDWIEDLVFNVHVEDVD